MRVTNHQSPGFTVCQGLSPTRRHADMPLADTPLPNSERNCRDETATKLHPLCYDNINGIILDLHFV
ncbi:unnamed protein product [Colias eurytheme]|nr:unnamed protein product [Colias eurytheme]